MIDLAKVQQKIELIESALVDLNEVEKDFIIQQYIAKRANSKQKTKLSDLMGGIDLWGMQKRMMKEKDKDDEDENTKTK